MLWEKPDVPTCPNPQGAKGVENSAYFSSNVPDLGLIVLRGAVAVSHTEEHLVASWGSVSGHTGWPVAP